MKNIVKSCLLAMSMFGVVSLTACVTSQEGQATETNTNTTESSVNLSKYDNQHDFCPKVTEQTWQKCTTQGGTLQQQGRAQCYSCTITYSDAGKTCNDHSECQGSCYSLNMVNPDTPTTGQCSANNSRFGCRQEVVNGKAHGSMLCVD